MESIPNESALDFRRTDELAPAPSAAVLDTRTIRLTRPPIIRTEVSASVPEVVEATPAAPPAPEIITPVAEGPHRHRAHNTLENPLDWWRRVRYDGGRRATTTNPLKEAIHSTLRRVRTSAYTGHVATAAAAVTMATASIVPVVQHDSSPPPAAASPIDRPPAYESAEQVKVPPAATKPNAYPRVVLQPSKYSEAQRVIEPNPKTYVDLPNGTRVKSSTLNYNKRLKLIENNINAAHPTPEGYQDFVSHHLHDLSGVVPKEMSNFNGHNLGTPKRPLANKVKYWVWHLTFTSNSATHLNGEKFAHSMQNSGSLAVQANLNKDGEGYWLTNSLTYHVRRHNSESMGMEISASEQADAQAEQYEDGIYFTEWQLIRGGYITKKTPSVTKVVNGVVKGHRELNARPGEHTDNPKMVMDPVRSKLINLLVASGYHR